VQPNFYLGGCPKVSEVFCDGPIKANHFLFKNNNNLNLWDANPPPPPRPLPPSP